jgi:hypothetical protein
VDDFKPPCPLITVKPDAVVCGRLLNALGEFR